MSNELFQITLQMITKRVFGVALLLSIITIGTLVYALVNLHFPNTLQVHVRNQFVLFGPSPGAVSILTGTSMLETLTVQNNNNAPAPIAIIYSSNSTSWTVQNSVRALTMTFNSSAPVGVTGDPACVSSPILCEYSVILPAGRNVLVANITASWNAPVSNPTIDFYLSQ